MGRIMAISKEPWAKNFEVDMKCKICGKKVELLIG
jgi:hypothetical protein